MGIDFTKCEIVQPEGRLLKSFYRELWEVFPYDRPIYEVLMEKGSSFYPMRNYALYSGDTLLGNAGIFPLKIWQKGKQMNLSGIGAVATMPGYRRQGVASRLLKHCLSIVDRQQDVSILFTELPAVYEPFGFKTVTQEYMSIIIEDGMFPPLKSCDFREIHVLKTQDLDTVRELYSSVCPVYDGKVVRESNYWKYYRMMFDPYDKPKIVFCCLKGKHVGYVRYETESDRLTITEFCCHPEQKDVIDSLLYFLTGKSVLCGFRTMTIALGKDHFLWPYLEERDIASVPESPGPRREIFMIRPAAARKGTDDVSLFWPLSDKF